MDTKLFNSPSLSPSLSIFLSLSLSFSLSVCLSASVCLFVCPFVCQFVCLSLSFVVYYYRIICCTILSTLQVIIARTCFEDYCTVYLYSTVQYSTVQYSTVQYSTVQYSTDLQYKYIYMCTVLYCEIVQFMCCNITALYTVK